MIRVAVVGEDTSQIVADLEKSTIHHIAKVVRSADEIREIAHEVDLAIAYSNSAEACKLHDICGSLGVQLQLIPSGQKVKREVSGDELIKELMNSGLFSGRPKAPPLDGSYIEGKRVLITGAGGSIGSDLALKVAQFKPEHLTVIDNSENGVYEVDLDLAIEGFTNKTAIVTDIRDKQRLESIFAQARPEIVYHVAARKHVPLMEKYPEEAVTTNIYGTIITLELAKKHDVKLFTFISTDKAADPCNAMGASKRIAERVIQRHAKANQDRRFCIVRFENVLDSQGNVVYTFQRQLEKTGNLTVTSPEMNRFFITRNEASSFIIRASGIARHAEVYVPDAGKPVFIADLARTIAGILGFREGIDYKITFTKPRPGEKMSEELLTLDEQKRSTKMEALYMCPMTDNDPPNFEEDLTQIMKKANEVDRKAIFDLLGKLEPTYKP